MDTFEVGFAAVHGRKGEVHRIENKPPVMFRGEQFVACDDFGGTGTLIRQIYANGKPVMSGPPIQTVAFGPEAFGSRKALPAVAPWETIAIEVEFLADGAWSGKMTGKGIG